jgi:PAS domain S-box-containing protein
LKNKDGSIAGINVAAEEITERKHAQAAPFAWTADPSGRRTWFNKRWHDYAGTTLEEMKGWGWQKLHHPDHADHVFERMRAAYEAGAPWEDTFQLRRRDGQFRWFVTRAVPIRGEGKASERRQRQQPDLSLLPAGGHRFTASSAV